MIDLVHRLSHDLRAPLRGAASSAEWIVEGLGPDVPEDVADAVSSLQHCVARMQALLDGLLELSRAGAADPSHSFEVAEQIRAAAHPIDGLRIVVEGDARCAGRGPDFFRAITPILENVVVHHPQRSGTACVRIEADADRAKIVVQDDGSGFIDAKRAFDLFATRFGASNPSHVGVGLTVARAAAEAHGGELKVLSENAQTTVQLTWPIASAGGQA